MKRAALLLAFVACGEDRARPSIRLDRPVAEWRLSRGEWERTIVEPYVRYYEEYARAFEAAAPALEAQRVASRAKPKTVVTSRQHYAGDPDLTRGQARTRWALPVQFPALVAQLDGVPIDAVFVQFGNSYQAIVGIDQLVIDKTRALDEKCARYLETLGSKPCQVVGWAIADAALRADAARLQHACSLATTQCAQ